ncbi:DUF1592 domain-containing protein [Rubinisphaera sp.]|uniref:DUF1592 domain-containing protein n=1 Tax=Rubinisphaera sp. TaxID=2024857 RepID=UPI0025DD5432|nr:DUF1592 domain-containing protein [Rubinisphaera sp.]
MIRLIPFLLLPIQFVFAIPAAGFDSPAPVALKMINHYCVDCHSGTDPSAQLNLESLLSGTLVDKQATWEKVIKKLKAGQMPPPDADQPEEVTIAEVLKSLEQPLDRHVEQNPNPGHTETFRRLTRTEYHNVIRDLLSIDIDVDSFLPADEVSHGFDNITVGELSPTLLNRYISAAQKISQLAVGRSSNSPGGKTYRLRPDITQEQRMDGLPVGTRGGTLISHTFPQDGEYEIRIRLTRDRNEHVEGLSKPHDLELLLDRELVKTFTVRPPNRKANEQDDYSPPSHENVDQHLVKRINVTAGPHDIGVTFLKESSSLLESYRQPLNVHYNMYRHPRLGPAIYQVSITGPYSAEAGGESPSRNRIFITRPADCNEEEEYAEEIIRNLLRKAIRRPITEADLKNPLTIFRQHSEQAGFEAGIEMALSSILVHPEFLFRIEEVPEGVEAGTAYRVSDVELASRLSFFLWSSLPDEELLELAEARQLSEPDVLSIQVMRMLADPRSSALVVNFAGQWLHLRNLDSITPDGRLYPDFDDNLRQAFRQETELFFESILREDRSVLELLKSDYTFLNERLAKHYGIPHVFGTRFRKVSLGENSQRGGLLRHGSILTVTSYATRTSPVIRGKWILENILGTPPPPPPANIPALEDNTVSASLPIRERLAQHRADAACASCHNLIDPPGFSLENFDAIGRWRDLELDHPVDAEGGLPDGRQFTGADGLETGILERPEVFVETLIEKLMTYSLGRGVEYYDLPAIRKIVRNARDDDYRFSSLIQGIIISTPFQMRMVQ